MEFFTQAVDVLKVLVMAVGAGLGAWGVINLMEGYGMHGKLILQLHGNEFFHRTVSSFCVVR